MPESLTFAQYLAANADALAIAALCGAVVGGVLTSAVVNVSRQMAASKKAPRRPRRPRIPRRSAPASFDFTWN